jgi:tetratricopeptide (TPR) repeat protein
MAAQRSLFPDAFEIEERALEALDEFDTAGAREHLRAARAADPGLPRIGLLEAAVEWLHRRTGGDAGAASVAGAFRAVPSAVRSGELPRSVTGFVDRALARFGLRVADGPFLDDAERVHRGALHLVLGNARRARELLSTTPSAGGPERPDLEGYLGDALRALERFDDANERYVRALVLDPDEVDLHRTRHRDLADLESALLAAHDAPTARALLLARAWMDGVLAIPRGNDWLAGRLSLLRGRLSVRATAPAPARLRFFSLLVYVDRSRPRSELSMSDRETMSELAPDLFAEYMQVNRRHERDAL